MPSKKDIEGLNKQQKSSGSQHSRSVANSGPPSYYSATMPKTPPRSVAALSEASFVTSSAPPSSKESKVSFRHAPSTASTKHHKAPSKASKVPEKDERLRGHSIWNESDVYAGGDDGGPGEQSHHGDSEPAKSNHGSTHGGRKTREQSHHEDEGGDGESQYGMPRESSPHAESVGGGGQPYCAGSINDDTRSQASDTRKPQGWERDRTHSRANSIIISGNGRYEKKKDGSSKSMISGSQGGGEKDSRKDKTPSESGKNKTPSESGRSKTYSESGKSKTPSESGKIKRPSESGKSKTPSESGKGKTPSQSGRSDTKPSKSIRNGGSDDGGSQSGSQSGSHRGVEGNDREDKTPSQSEIGDIEPPELMGNGGSDYGGSRAGSRRGGQGYHEKNGKKVAFSSAGNPAQPLDDIQECEREFERFDVSGGGRGTGRQVISTNWQAASHFLRKPDEYGSINEVPRGKVLTDKDVHARKAKGHKPREEPKRKDLEKREKIAHSWGK
ncbi:hypothetical protein BOTNAR_0023g00380 [Botryotinia narcissicola]|uniref:Uncharacterized protein n=1 Tax=Botryotinia narcissicola TaxID=278944 RepID=A0A4Z1J4B5_9HELO|nr:hypothetical protein BOTNAR_0023g00380 [Botryotinia narcissicola]